MLKKSSKILVFSLILVFTAQIAGARGFNSVSSTELVGAGKQPVYGGNGFFAPLFTNHMPVLVSWPRIKISVAPTPIAQTVVGGVTQFHFATYFLDASASDDSIRFSSLPVAYVVYNQSVPTNLTACILYDGVRMLTTGSNVIYPSQAASSTTFTFDGSGYIVPAKTLKQIDLKCNIASGATGAYSWGFDASVDVSAIGLTSNKRAEITKFTSMGQKMTVVASGSYRVTDDSTPGYRVVNSSAAAVTLLRLRFSAFEEGIDIKRVNFQLSNTASNTPLDLINDEIKLYDEASPNVLLGTAKFGTGDFATSSILSNFVVSKGSSKTLLIKGDINSISTSGPLLMSGDLLKVDYDGDANGINNGNYGVGITSGVNITPNSPDTSMAGVRIMKAYPIFQKLSLPFNVLRNQSDFPLYRFRMRAEYGDVHIFKTSFNVSETRFNGSAPTHATTSKYSLYSYLDMAYSVPDTTTPGSGTAPGLINGRHCYGDGLGNGLNNNVGLGGERTEIEIISASGCNTSTTTYRIPSGAIRYFELRADVRDVENVSGVVDSIEVKLLGDAAFPTSHQCGVNMKGDMGVSGVLNAGGVCSGMDSGVNADLNDDFIWSPGSISSAPTLFDVDFTNAYQLPGLPANDMPVEIFTSVN